MSVEPPVRDRLDDLEKRRAWCKAWLDRQYVRHPRITPEWRGLLDDVAWAVDEIRRLRERSS